MSELNEFFEQILHTERSLSSRNVKLRQLKEEINSCVSALQRLREEVKTRQGELAVRNVKMVDQEVEAKLLDLKKTILEEQSRKLSQANQLLIAELEALKTQMESDSEHFLDELKEFGRSYDLIGCGYKHREEQTQKRVCTLQDEVLLLEAELAEFESEREEVKKLEQRLVEVENTLQQKRENKKVLEDQILNDEAEAKQLSEESVISNSKISTDPEIIKLQNELEECRDCLEEKTYHSLHKELEELQRQCYHRQMKQHLSRRQHKDPQGRHSSGGIASRLSHHLPGHYNPYTHQYVPSLGIHEVGSGVEYAGEGGGESEGREEESCVLGGTSAGIGPDEEDGEGWDDELEAMDLTSISELEWGEDGGLYGGDGGGEVREKEGEGVSEQEEKQVKTALEHKEHLSGTIRAGRNKYSFIKPSLNSSYASKAVRTVVKSCGVRPVDSACISAVLDSPMPGEIALKKSSGQSIYKAPGQLHGVPKTAKRVRFRY